MTELITGILTTTCLCGMSYMLVKLCSMRKELELVQPEYVLISKEQYDCLKKHADVKIIFEQPQMSDPLLPEQSQLPSYSERVPSLI